MGKRATEKSSGAKVTAKKSKVEAKVDPAFASVGEAIMAVDQLPQSTRDMLVDMLPFSLKFGVDERQELQSMAVGMVEQTMTDKKSLLASTVAAVDGELARLKASESQLGATVSNAEAALASHKDAVAATKSALAEAVENDKTSTAHLKTVLKENEAAEENFVKMQADKAAIEAAFGEHFKPMEDGEGKAHYKKLEPFLKKLNIEATLLQALPAAAGKTKEKRGTFDHLVLEELQKAFHAQIAALGEAVVAEGPAAEKRNAAKQAAQEDADRKKASKSQTESELLAAKNNQSAGEVALSNAKQAVEEFQPKVQEVTERLSVAKQALETFEAGPFANFFIYQARIAAPPAEEAPAEDAHPEAVAPAEETAPAEVAAA